MSAPVAKTTIKLQDLVGSHPDLNEQLPLVHSTRCEWFREIAKEGELSPIKCPVFGEPLVYLFYGRPAYRSRNGGQPSTEITHCPICFVFKPYAVSDKIARVVPFDTGAAANGLFSPHIDRADFAKFILGSRIDLAQRMTHLFFGSNKKYFLGEARRLLSFADASVEVLNYLSLVHYEGESLFDDRRSAIEVQVREHVALRDTLMAVILPLAFLEAPEDPVCGGQGLESLSATVLQL